MRRYQLGFILVLLGPAGVQGHAVKPADLAGEWVLAHELYGETGYARLTVEAADDRVTAALWDMKLAGGIDDGKIVLKRSGNDRPAMNMTGTVQRDEMTGDFTVGELMGTWKAIRIPVRPPSAPREHVFEPKEFHRVFSGAIAPVLHIYPGDTVKTWSVDAAGLDAKGIRRSLGGNPQTGPFYIEGALPGDTLVVKLTRIRLNRDSAISSGSLALSAVTPDYAVGKKPVENYDSSWVLDREKGVARLAKPTEALKDYTVPLRPFLGCLGVAPPGRMVYRSGYPGSFGGNMDYNRLREGVTLYLPVSQPGALLFMGDGHAAQGDGELTGNALETSMDIEFSVDVIPRGGTAMPRAEDDEFLMAMGIAGSLTEALQVATSEMARWLEKRHDLNASEVASVLGTAMRYDIAEVVDPYVNVVARVPKKALAPIRRAGRRP
jgi:acetamidase/formamidase